MKYISLRHTILAENQNHIFRNEHYSLTVITNSNFFSLEMNFGKSVTDVSIHSFTLQTYIE